MLFVRQSREPVLQRQPSCQRITCGGHDDQRSVAKVLNRWGLCQRCGQFGELVAQAAVYPRRCTVEMLDVACWLRQRTIGGNEPSHPESRQRWQQPEDAAEGAVERWIRRQALERLGRLGVEEDYACNQFGIPPSEDPDVRGA